jgi:hypothetical protein
MSQFSDTAEARRMLEERVLEIPPEDLGRE